MANKRTAKKSAKKEVAKAAVTPVVAEEAKAETTAAAPAVEEVKAAPVEKAPRARKTAEKKAPAKAAEKKPADDKFIIQGALRYTFITRKIGLLGGWFYILFNLYRKDRLTMIDEMYNYREGNLPAVTLPDEWDELAAEFEATLTAEQREMFRRLSDLQCTATADELRMVYKVGFRDGAEMMLDVLC